MMTNGKAEGKDLRAALEEFVLDFDSIDNLERRFAGFNVFEAIGHTLAEERHSNFLAFLIDPQETHGLGDFFLKRFIQETLRNVDPADRAIDLVKLSISDLDQTLVWREQHNIDVLAVNDNENFVVVIENKIRSSEHSGQLQRYRKFVERNYPKHCKLFVYLTADGDAPSDPAYTAISYEKILGLVNETMTTRGQAVSLPVRQVLEDYGEILRRYIVPDEELIKLARSIYQKHSRALDFIFEQRPDLALEISEILRKLIEGEKSLEEDHSSKAYVRFVPRTWTDIKAFSSTSKYWTSTGRALLFEFRNTPTRLSLHLVLGPIDDKKLREDVYEFCRSNKEIFKGLTDKVYPQFMNLFLRNILDQIVLERGNREELEAEIRLKWSEFVRGDLPKIEILISEKFSSR